MTNLSGKHDPSRTLSGLRDQLAQHDKPIAFLFGAGTSCSVKKQKSSSKRKPKPLIPAVAELTRICRSRAGKLGDPFKNAWALIEAECTRRGEIPNVENVLSQLRMMLAAITNNDTLAGLHKPQITQLENSVRRTIAKAVTPKLAGIPEDFPHLKFARWLLRSTRKVPIEIFTVNYDVLIEYALELERVPVFDGFVGSHEPFFYADSLRQADAAPGARWTRLWKMHGSVSWRRFEKDGNFRIVRGTPDNDGEMIYPSFLKYDESRQQPYSAFTERLSRFLEQDDVILISCGFSFSDEHINNLIFGGIESKPRTHVYALQFSEPDENSDLIRRSCRHPNIVVIGPETGVIGGQRSAWAESELPESMSVAFRTQPTKTPSSGDDARDRGRRCGPMKIGRFESFCDFLESMTLR